MPNLIEAPLTLATTDGHVVELHLTPDRPLCLLVRGHGASIALDLTARRSGQGW